MIEARNLEFAYPGRRAAVSGVSLVVQQGRLAGLIGPNGSGKSTLMRLIAGILSPQRGEVRLMGTALDSLDRRQLARLLAYVPQSTASIFPFTALEVVLAGRTPYSAGFRFETAEDTARARAALSAVGAEGLEGRRVTELSAGERQLVTVARALAQEPACLLLDEPAAGLDLKHRALLVRLLRRLCDESKLTALTATHDIELLEPAFDRVLALRCGRIVAEGEPHEVLRESVLAEVFEDPFVRASRVGERTFVWSEV